MESLTRAAKSDTNYWEHLQSLGWTRGFLYMCCTERQGNEKIKETVTQIVVLEEKVARYTKRKKVEVFPHYSICYLLSLEKRKSKDKIMLMKQWFKVRSIFIGHSIINNSIKTLFQICCLFFIIIFMSTFIF